MLYEFRKFISLLLMIYGSYLLLVFALFLGLLHGKLVVLLLLSKVAAHIHHIHINTFYRV